MNESRKHMIKTLAVGFMCMITYTIGWFFVQSPFHKCPEPEPDLVDGIISIQPEWDTWSVAGVFQIDGFDEVELPEGFDVDWVETVINNDPIRVRVEGNRIYFELGEVHYTAWLKDYLREPTNEDDPS